MINTNKRRGLARVLHWIEVGGNALPHPASLFGILALMALLFSWIGHLADWTAVHPATGEEIHTVNLLSKSGFHRIMLEMVDNYTSFAPLGIVMVAILGIGTLISTMLPYSLLFFVVWTLLLVLWIVLNLPLGPGAGIYYGL